MEGPPTSEIRGLAITSRAGRAELQTTVLQALQRHPALSMSVDASVALDLI